MPESRDVPEDILDRVSEILAAMSDEFDPATGASELGERVSTLNAPKGPADVAAYHDYHHLELFFQPLLTRMPPLSRFDVADFYSTWMRVREFNDYEEDDPALVSWLDELPDLLAAAEREAAEASAFDDPTYDQAAAFFPSLSAELWEWIGPVRRRQVHLFIIGYEQAVAAAEAARESRRSGSGFGFVRDFLEGVASLSPPSLSSELLGAVFGGGGGEAAAASGLSLEEQRLLFESQIAEWERARLLEKAGDLPPSSVAKNSWAELRATVRELRDRLKKNRYEFPVYHPGSTNFGLLLTHRQVWDPQTYQAGELVATIPLAPGETRKVTAKKVVKTSRQEVSSLRTSSTQRSESSTTTRAEAEIMKKAAVKNSFQNQSEMSGGFGSMVNASNTMTINAESSSETSRTQRNFRESVLKAVEEYKRDRKIEITTSSEQTIEETSSGEISNPNNEITVTYLLYELQRRYLVTDYLKRVRPVVLVAQDFPAPYDLDDDWLLANASILRKVLLDESFEEVLDYLEDSLAGDVINLETLRDQWDVQRKLVIKLQSQVESLINSRSVVRDSITAGILGKANADVGLFPKVARALYGGLDADEVNEAAMEASERSLEYVEGDLRQVSSRLAAALDSYAQATKQLTELSGRIANWKIRIDQLRVHVLKNACWYMQHIWDHEVPDQRYLRLAETPVLVPDLGDEDVISVRSLERRIVDLITNPDGASIEEELGDKVWDVEIPAAGSFTTKVQPLHAIADLNEPIYFGNMIGFPLKEHNYVTFAMAAKYIDKHFGIGEPNWWRALDIDRAIDALQAEDLTTEERQDILRGILQRLKQPLQQEEVVIPTDELFIEALPGAHPVLEHFKLAHRKVDVERAFVEREIARLDATRRAAKLMDGEYDDPDIDQNIAVSSPSVLPTIPVTDD